MNRRLLFAIIFVLFFALGVIFWFFLYADKKSTPSFEGTNNPLSLSNFPKKFQFIYNNDEEGPFSESTTEVTLAKPEVLTKIWGRPTAGQTFVIQDIVKEVEATSTQGTTTITVKKLVQATSTILMFVDRITGYVYGHNRETGAIYQISNTTIPGIYDAYIFNNGKRIVLRYRDEDKNTIVGVLANIPQISEKDQAKPLEGTTYLPTQVTSVALNKKGTLLSYLVERETGASIYTVDQKGATLVANTPFREWSLSYGGDVLYATTRPSAYLEGQTVKLPSFEFVVGGKTGLMSNPGETNVFVNSMWSSRGLKTFISSNDNQTILTITTLASKCSWGRNNFLICAVPKTLHRTTEGLPDDWFQGRFSFEDSLVTIDTRKNEITPLFSFETKQQIPFDVIKISLSEENSLVAFNRKQDASLWLLDTTLIESE